MAEAPDGAGAGSARDTPWSSLLDQVVTAFEDAVLVTEARPLDEPGPRIVYANDAFSAMTGYRRDEVLGRSCRFLQGPATSADARRVIREALEASERVRAELLNYRKDGSTFWNEVLISPLRDESGTVTHFVSVQRDTTARKAAEVDLQRRLLRSDVTGLANRAGLEAELERALQDTESRPCALVLFDVAGLRNINYTHGRKGGDHVLLEVAARLQRIAVEEATVAQLAGGEFGLLLRDATVPSVVRLCEYVRRALFRPVEVLGTQLTLAISGGVALSTGASTASSLLREADVARRVAATAGVGRYEFFEPEMGRALEQHMDIDQGLRCAVGNGELVLHHQPVVRLRDGGTTHAEALVRWNRPGQGFISPASFIPVAESSGAIVPVGTWVLQEACRQAAAWQSALPDIGVAVNLSPRQFAGPDLATDVVRALDGLPPELLTLEVTEGALLQDPSAAAQQLHRLAATGIRVALDDFGTGFSSLAYLKRLPVHTIKVDKTFVDGIQHDPGDRAIVRAVLGLAGDLGLDVVAEGVETADQREALLELGCTRAQGYLFSRPVPASDLAVACRAALSVQQGPGLSS